MAGIYVHSDPITDPENIGVHAAGKSSGSRMVSRNRGKGPQNRVFGTNLTQTGGHNPSTRHPIEKKDPMRGMGARSTVAPATVKPTVRLNGDDVEVMHIAPELSCEMFADELVDVEAISRPRLRFAKRKRAVIPSAKIKLDAFTHDENHIHGDVPALRAPSPTSLDLPRPAEVEFTEFELPDLGDF